MFESETQTVNTRYIRLYYPLRFDEYDHVQWEISHIVCFLQRKKGFFLLISCSESFVFIDMGDSFRKSCFLYREGQAQSNREKCSVQKELINIPK